MMGKASAYLALGPTNLLRVGAYRLLLKAGIHPVQRLQAKSPVGSFFHETRRVTPQGAIARQTWRSEAIYFGWRRTPLTDRPPNWLANSFRPDVSMDAARPWWEIPDFDPAVGDIKTVWEASRFDWLIAMAQRAALGEATEIQRLNEWLTDWSQVNPPFYGPNWKCGQEASIRLMHLALAAFLLGQLENPAKALVELARIHLARIAPTMSYAIGQQNNHGTSEAAALFIGGAWLERLGIPGARLWHQTGRRWLENRARELIEEDGTFSQYSVTYHRVMLDTYAFAEVWRRYFELPAFSGMLQSRLAAATTWLIQLVDPVNGDVPNIGANDGARILAMSDTDYRDFRPSAQLAAALYLNEKAYTSGHLVDQALIWLAIELPKRNMAAPPSHSFDGGGLHVLRHGRAVAYLRYPRFRFRPSQADALHLDFWVDGVNILRDGGTYSYNVTDNDNRYFGGAASHNLVEFDGRDQMPRLGRFLFGEWLRARSVSLVASEGQMQTAAAGYCDYRSAQHTRRITLGGKSLVCQDTLAGNFQKAVLRWRLIPGAWQLNDRSLTDGRYTLSIEASHPISGISSKSGYESRYYLDKTELPVFEIELSGPNVVKTTISY